MTVPPSHPWAAIIAKARKPSKYRNVRVTVDGHKFASKREAARYRVLRDMEQRGEIYDLKLQVPFVLIPKQGRERAVRYVADFVYDEPPLFRRVVEDVKGFRTPDYVIKRKLMLHVHGIAIREVGGTGKARRKRRPVEAAGVEGGR